MIFAGEYIKKYKRALVTGCSLKRSSCESVNSLQDFKHLTQRKTKVGIITLSYYSDLHSIYA